jgi:pimeloyl-ACP methyl ester carboxylesterase
VLCEPDHPARQAPTLVFCSTGGDPRAGVGGFSTGTARLLAQRGVASLRFDYSGLGDSPMPGDDPRCHVFETPREAETDAAVSFLKARGYDDITLFGVCAGAYHALRAAWGNPEIDAVFAVSPVKLVWRSGDTLTFGRYKNGRPTSAYLKALADPVAWKQALETRVDLPAVLLTLMGRLRSRLTGWATRSGPASPLRQMEQFSRRGGRACFIMGVNDASLEELATYFGAKGTKLQRMPETDVQIIPQLDHGLACNVSRRLAADALQDWLIQPRDGRSTPVISAGASRGLPQTGLGCSPT